MQVGGGWAHFPQYGAVRLGVKMLRKGRESKGLTLESKGRKLNERAL